MSKIWITSDLHLGHDREFIWGARGYADVNEMNGYVYGQMTIRVPEDEKQYKKIIAYLEKHNITYKEV